MNGRFASDLGALKRTLRVFVPFDARQGGPSVVAYPGAE